MATLTLGGKDYDTEALPGELQNLINIFSTWEGELRQARVEVYKLEAAVKSIALEIEMRIKQLEVKPEAPQAPQS